MNNVDEARRRYLAIAEANGNGNEARAVIARQESEDVRVRLGIARPAESCPRCAAPAVYVRPTDDHGARQCVLCGISWTEDGTVAEAADALDDALERYAR